MSHAGPRRPAIGGCAPLPRDGHSMSLAGDLKNARPGEVCACSDGRGEANRLLRRHRSH